MNTLIPAKIIKKTSFIGRLSETSRLNQIAERGEATIIVVYGRRRVGKTELLEQTFAERGLLKFEGLERQPRKAQLREFARMLAGYAQDAALAHLAFNSWTEALSLLARYVKEGRWTIYLEELQWMANYDTELVSALKSVWDNEFRHNPQLLLVLCGSAPSFMVNKVLHSAALYNRTEIDFPIAPFNLPEAHQYFGGERSPHEVMDAVLSVGAVPPYLERLKEAPSAFLGLAQHSFRKNSYFLNEYERIFTSSLAANPNYRRTLEYLSDRAYAERSEILSFLNKKPGGEFSALLKDLEQTGFIQSYSPPRAAPRSRTIRYEISDPFIRFYNKFIRSCEKEIRQGLYDAQPQVALNVGALRPWLGLSFERWLRQHPFLLSRILGFDGIKYQCGAFFSRTSPGAQIDLVYDRPDRFVTMVEIKYTDSPVGTDVIAEFEHKIKLYPLRKKSLQKVLVSARGIDRALLSRGYFDKVIVLEDLFDARIW